MSDKNGRSITRSALSNAVISAVEGISGDTANSIVDIIIDTIKSGLSKGDEVLISGFGKFVVLDKKARPGRNPRTGEAVNIQARRVTKFRPSDVLRNIINDKIV